MAEQIQIDDVVLPTVDNGFVVVEDLSELWWGPEVRGEDRLLPGVAGVIAYPRRPTVSVRSVRMVILGEKDASGTPHADGRLGLEANVAYLRANVTDPPAGGDGTRLLTLTMPSGFTRSARVHVAPLRIIPMGATSAAAVLEVSIPAGALAEVS